MQSDTSPKISEEPVKKSSRGSLLWFLCGVLWGAVLMFIAGVIYLRHNLIREIPIREDFSHVISALEPAARKLDWQVSANPCGIPRLINGQPIEIFRLCKREYAVSLLMEESDRKIACLLPCAVSVYQKADGVTYLSRLNMPLVTQLLGGTSVAIVRDKIQPEQNAVFSIFTPIISGETVLKEETE